MAMYDFSGKKGVVTAASAGIGKAVAQVLSTQGVELLISSGNDKRIQAAADDISSITGNPVHWQKCDLKKLGEVDSLKDKVVEKFGKLDFIVINYGDPKLDEFMKLEENDWNESINMFIGSTVKLVKGLVPHLNTPGGRIIFITSSTTRQARESFALSGALRAAVVNLGKILSLELAPGGLTVNSISQGFFNTDRLKGVLRRNASINGTSMEVELERIEKQVPVGRVGKPEEIGKLVAFLCSEDASYINGTNIPIDGGSTRYPY